MGERSLHELFEEQAARRPEALALVSGSDRLTYGELNGRANRLAHHLRERGVCRETLVALRLERTPELVVSVLGVLKAGGAYVPLDPGHPEERHAYVLEDTGARLLLTRESLLEAAEDLARQPETNPEPWGGPGDLAYVIYTSGSTGRPKGVMVEHRQVVRLLSATEPWYGFGEEDVWTLFHTYAFDFSVWEIWGALAYGGRLVMVPGAVARSPEEFHELLFSEGVTVLNQTPTAFAELIEADARSRHRDGLGLRLVIFGGEKLDFQTLCGWFERHGADGPRLVNMYGITETTVHVTYRPVTAEDARSAVSEIGRPIPDLRLLVVDRHLREVPLGAAGELLVAGAGLARGYLGKPGLTAERFVPDPQGGGGRCYRSGDLVRRLPSGDLEYLGRIDQQVKIRGYRVELGEIEAALRAHPGVRDAAVVAREEGGGRRLVAYTTAALPPGPSGEELRRHLQGRLPGYMVPPAYVALERLPMTVNGKVDRRALPVPEGARDLSAAYVEPRTEVEGVVAEIWAEVLGVERVGVHDDFFELGGDSISSMRVISRVREAFEVQVPLRTLFAAPTVAGLAEQVEETVMDAILASREVK